MFYILIKKKSCLDSMLKTFHLRVRNDYQLYIGFIYSHT